MTELEAIPLKRQRSEVAETDIKKCIICQIDTNESTCSNAQARMKILEAARIRNDILKLRMIHWFGKPILQKICNSAMYN